MKKIKSMTCIAVAKNRYGKLMMAGDRQATYDWGHREYMSEAKIKKQNGIVVGFSGDCGLGLLLTHAIDFPRVETKDALTYMLYTFKPKILSMLRHHGYVDETKSLKIPAETEVTMLVIVLNKLYRVLIHNPEPDIKERSNGEIAIESTSYPNAVGCGDMPAIISLKKDLKRVGYNTREHLLDAINMACEMSPGCGLNNQKPDLLTED